MKRLALLAFALLTSTVCAQTSAGYLETGKPVRFLDNHLNRYLVISDFSARMMDAVSTRQAQTTTRLVETGTFYGLFSMKPIAKSTPAMYAWSGAEAVGQSMLSGYLWHRGERSRHAKLYRLASRAVITFDAVNETALVVKNYQLIAAGTWAVKP